MPLVDEQHIYITHLFSVSHYVRERRKAVHLQMFKSVTDTIGWIYFDYLVRTHLIALIQRAWFLLADTPFALVRLVKVSVALYVSL